MMAAILQVADNDDCAVTAPNGWAFPPFTVMEKGEALDEWARRIKPDFPTVLMVLCHLCARLQQLHRAGVAHRDVKPANCLWRPRAHSWTLIDFGCAGEIGAVAVHALLPSISFANSPSQPPGLCTSPMRHASQ